MKGLQINDIEWKEGTRGEYMSVTLTDGQKYFTRAVFDDGHKKLLQEAYDSGQSVNVQFEKRGNFWNVKSVEIGNGTPKPDKPAERKWTPKNDDDIMLQVALKAVVELERHHFVPEGKLNVGRIAEATNELFASLLMMRPKRETDKG